MTSKEPVKGWILILPLALLCGCTASQVELDTLQHHQKISNDRQILEPSNQKNVKVSLSLQEAMETALRENLDARVAAMELVSAQGDITLEAIRALPSLDYTLARNGRNKESASTSFSVLTGQQSLEPSISSERYRNTRDINLNWNIIDAATAILQARTATDRADISAERYSKVRQNIYRDVRSAYWRAWAGDQTAAKTRDLIAQARGHIENLDEAERQKLISRTEAAKRREPIVSVIASLENLQNEGRLANIELKSLLNIPQSTTVALVSKPRENSRNARDVLRTDMEQLETLALLERPEMREAFLERNISIRDTKAEIIRTIPGTELFYGLSRDSNRFLENDRWQTYTLSLVQNITNLLTLPKRYSIARKNEELSEARRVTLAAAIIAQLHIARHGLAHAKELEALAKQEQKTAQAQSFAAVKRRDGGQLGQGEALVAQMQAHEKTYEALQATAQTQDSYAALLNALGLGLEDSAPLNLSPIAYGLPSVNGGAS